MATPDYMEELIRATVEGCEKIEEFNVIKGKELDDRGMKLHYNVGKSATSEPRLITCIYKGKPDSDNVDFALVGKGVTFDTGGLNLKATGVMEDNYSDKGGA